jgi:hypothetical protein
MREETGRGKRPETGGRCESGGGDREKRKRRVLKEIMKHKKARFKTRP